MTDTPAAPTTPKSGYDRRALTDDQRSLADDIASAMNDSHAAECDVWNAAGDGCTCGLLIDVADGLAGARIVEVIQELGYDPTTHRGDRLVRRSFNPHPLARYTPAEPLDVERLAQCLKNLEIGYRYRDGWIAVDVNEDARDIATESARLSRNEEAR